MTTLKPIEILALAVDAPYFRAKHPDGRSFRMDTLVWESHDAAHWANYIRAFTFEAGYARATYPDGTVFDVLPTEVIHQPAKDGDGNAVDPASGDTAIGLGQSQGENIFTLNGSTTASEKLGIAQDTQQLGAVVAGTLLVGTLTTDLPATVDNAYRGRSVIFTSGALVKMAFAITGFIASTGTITFTPAPVAAAIGDTFIVV